MSGFALHLLRHGEAAGAGCLLGHGDGPPLKSGVRACLERAAGLDIRQVLASDLSRAAEPARRIATAARLPLRIDPRWRELDFGQWDGQSASDIDPVALGAFWKDPDASPPPGGERWSALRGRVTAALADITGPTLVVAHAGSVRAALSCLLDLSHRQCWSIALPYGALISLVIRNDGAQRSAQITGLVT
ncbi:histidine phosphatase family protein [Stakelama tenebrarum]|uniref:Histidine phosphatase family protein n=1 Tax=Stakelama tenebrarum TaxID=2711215 RepID=A0A6G6Y2J1_9SPHN|nr:histidine phosphatase family protein [Sphingosinithalassobacter tenebrarum]QIG79061.1 histidine phosphatase family protein [Sphingosinithalassobacter tenebrarum]